MLLLHAHKSLIQIMLLHAQCYRCCCCIYICCSMHGAADAAAYTALRPDAACTVLHALLPHTQRYILMLHAQCYKRCSIQCYSWSECILDMHRATVAYTLLQILLQTQCYIPMLQAQFNRCCSGWQIGGCRLFRRTMSLGNSVRKLIARRSVCSTVYAAPATPCLSLSM